MPTTKRLFTVAHEAWQANQKKHQDAVVAFLSCTRDAASPANVLHSREDILKAISSFATFEKAEPDDRDRPFNAKVMAELCMGGEGVWVERLTQRDAGSLSNKFIGGALLMNAHIEWMRTTRVYTETNEDGSYWNEGQLRAHYVEFLRKKKWCNNPHRCSGLCYALPGDTLFLGDMYVRDWESASQEELEDRGWLHGGGLLFQYCQLARDDPSQLEQVDD